MQVNSESARIRGEALRVLFRILKGHIMWGLEVVETQVDAKIHSGICTVSESVAFFAAPF